MKELDDLPLYEYQELYHTLYLENEEEKRLSQTQKESKALQTIVEDSM